MKETSENSYRSKKAPKGVFYFSGIAFSRTFVEFLLIILNFIQLNLGWYIMIEGNKNKKMEETIYGN